MNVREEREREEKKHEHEETEADRRHECEKNKKFFNILLKTLTI